MQNHERGFAQGCAAPMFPDEDGSEADLSWDDHGCALRPNEFLPSEFSHAVGGGYHGRDPLNDPPERRLDWPIMFDDLTHALPHLSLDARGSQGRSWRREASRGSIQDMF